MIQLPATEMELQKKFDAYRELSEKIRENVRRILKEPAKRAEKGSGEEPAGTRRK